MYMNKNKPATNLFDCLLCVFGIFYFCEKKNGIQISDQWMISFSFEMKSCVTIMCTLVNCNNRSWQMYKLNVALFSHSTIIIYIFGRLMTPMYLSQPKKTVNRVVCQIRTHDTCIQIWFLLNCTIYYIFK